MISGVNKGDSPSDYSEFGFREEALYIRLYRFWFREEALVVQFQ
jgi:hypothetical protein